MRLATSIFLSSHMRVPTFRMFGKNFDLHICAHRQREKVEVRVPPHKWEEGFFLGVGWGGQLFCCCSGGRPHRRGARPLQVPAVRRRPPLLAAAGLPGGGPPASCAPLCLPGRGGRHIKARATTTPTLRILRTWGGQFARFCLFLFFGLLGRFGAPQRVKWKPHSLLCFLHFLVWSLPPQHRWTFYQTPNTGWAACAPVFSRSPDCGSKDTGDRQDGFICTKVSAKWNSAIRSHRLVPVSPCFRPSRSPVRPPLRCAVTFFCSPGSFLAPVAIGGVWTGCALGRCGVLE